MTARYWNAADQAELDLLVHTLVYEAWPHRGKPGYNEALADAVEVVVDWIRRRELLTRAAHLRARQDLEEWAA